MSKEKFMFAKPPPVPRAESLWLSSDSTNITTESMPEPAANRDVYATGAFAVMCVALLVIVGAVLRRMRGARAKDGYERLPARAESGDVGKRVEEQEDV